MTLGNINFRIFRRNQKNLIFLWDTSNLTQNQKSQVSANLVDGDRELSFNVFVPEDMSKFKNAVSGIVIGHSENALDASREYKISVKLGNEEDAMVFVKEVKPASAAQEENSRKLYLYALDASTKAWVPLAAKRGQNGQYALLISPIDQDDF